MASSEPTVSQYDEVYQNVLSSHMHSNPCTMSHAVYSNLQTKVGYPKVYPRHVAANEEYYSLFVIFMRTALPWAQLLHEEKKDHDDNEITSDVLKGSKWDDDVICMATVSKMLQLGLEWSLD